MRKVRRVFKVIEKKCITGAKTMLDGMKEINVSVVKISDVLPLLRTKTTFCKSFNQYFVQITGIILHPTQTANAYSIHVMEQCIYPQNRYLINIFCFL